MKPGTFFSHPLTLAVLLSVGSTPLHAAEAGGVLAGEGNLILDSSFEEPAATTRWKSADSASRLTTSQKRTGAQSVMLLNDGKGVPRTAVHNVTQPSIPVAGAVAGQEYAFTVHVRADNVTGIGAGGKPLIVLRWRDSSDKKLAEELYHWAPYGTYDFRKLALHFQAPTNAARLDVGFRSWWDCLTGTTYWDDASLTPRVVAGRGALLATYQAEDARVQTGGNIANAAGGFTGAGYFDVTNTAAILEWDTVARGGQHVIAVRYSWEGGARPLELFVNGASQGRKTPAWTGRVGSYATENWTANLRAGSNTIRVAIENASPAKGPTIDRLELYAATTSAGPPAGQGPSPR